MTSALDIWRACSGAAISDALRALRDGVPIRLARPPFPPSVVDGKVENIRMEVAEYEARQTRPTLIVVGRVEPDGAWEYIAHYDMQNAWHSPRLS